MAARRLTGLRSSVSAQNKVSLSTATQFSVHAATCRAVGTHAVAVDELFTETLHASGSSYAATETDNTIAARQGGGRP
ncbi:PE family protein [Mycobacterium sp.]|uniref:PE family protein n=1 Tax=Mycobacterium sp. TaxID=1785 RepID=UPI003F9A00A5